MRIYQNFFRAFAIASLTLSIATAQSTSTSGQTSTGGQAAGSSSTAQAESGAMVGKTDMTFMTKAAQGGMMEVQLAQMAQQKAASDDVKAYARKLEEDHSKANEQLKKIAQERNVQLPSDIGQHQQQVAKFQNLSGQEFDRAFMKMQVQHHKKDIGEFKKYQTRSMDTDLKEFAAAQMPVLQQHYEQAQQLAANTGTRSRTADKNNTTDSSANQSSTKQ
jgi:putative membrane protein